MVTFIVGESYALRCGRARAPYRSKNGIFPPLKGGFMLNEPQGLLRHS